MSAALLPLPDDDDVLIRRADLPQYIPVATQTLNRWACEGAGPRMTKIGKRIVAYKVGDIKEWLRSNTRNNTTASEDNG